VIDLAEALACAGHGVHVIYSERRSDNRFLAGIKKLHSAGVQFLRLDMAHGPHPTDVRVIGLLRKYLQQAGPFDLLHCHSTKAGLIGRLAALGLPCRTFYTPHAFLTMSPVAGLVSRLGAQVIEMSLSRIGHKVICVSDEERAHALDLGIPAQKLSVIPNGIDVDRTRQLLAERSAIRHRFGLTDDQVCVGFVGRLVPQKSPETLLSAFSNLTPDARASARLVLVGNGPLLPALKQQARELNLGDSVVFAGEMEGPLAMAAFDIFALPSRYEGFPYVLLEALAMGLPIASTNVGGAAAIVQPEENGFLVPVGAAAELSQALNKLIADSDLRKMMASKSLCRSEHFSIHRMLNETLAAYGHEQRHRPLPLEIDADQTTLGLAGLANALSKTKSPARVFTGTTQDSPAQPVDNQVVQTR
jgi:glycosyltransferase involved in cell wall biosynthesis